MTFETLDQESNNNKDNDNKDNDNEDNNTKTRQRQWRQDNEDKTTTKNDYEDNKNEDNDNEAINNKEKNNQDNDNEDNSNEWLFHRFNQYFLCFPPTCLYCSLAWASCWESCLNEERGCSSWLLMYFSRDVIFSSVFAIPEHRLDF